MHHALLREVAATFDRAIVGDRGRPPDVDLARKQHAEYRNQIAAAGYEVETLEADDDHPDCVFIEDTAVIVGELAVITHPGANSRVGEIGPVADVLGGRFPLVHVEAPGTLDGGDVMILGHTVWVGRSDRSNDIGIATLREAAGEQGLDVIVVPITEVLHLKSAVLPVGPDTVVVTNGTVDESLLGDLRILREDPEERHRFSALPLRDGRVLVTGAAPRTAAMLSNEGFDVHALDVSEILAADGGLTCMSILYER